MPIMDKSLTFCEQLSVAAASGATIAGDVADVGQVNIGVHENLYLVIAVSESFATGDSATVRFQFVSDEQPTIATNGTAIAHFTTPYIAAAELPAGTQIITQLPVSYPAASRYLGVLVTVAVGTMTAGSISVYLTPTPQNNRPYPEGVN